MTKRSTTSSTAKRPVATSPWWAWRGASPGARDLESFWQNLRAGRDSVTFLSDEELLAAGVDRTTFDHPDYVKAALLLDVVDRFDADLFDLRPREAEILDPQQRLFLEQAWHALEDAGHSPAAFDGLIGVYAGVAWNTYLLSNLTTHPELFDGGGAFEVFITSDKDFMPTRLSYKLDLKGPSTIVQTSCSTSLVATHLACLSLLSYECDLALVGGVTVKVPQQAGYFHQEGGLASPDGRCRAFDARAAGTIFGSGVGVVALRRLDEALADGDRIRAVIKGSAINNDGSLKVSYTAPSVEGQAEVVAAAQEMAGVTPDTIGYVEAHGTGTSLGDPIEVTALSKVFRQGTEDKGYCALGAVKSNVGHLDAAAGVAGLIKTVLALEHQEIPPVAHFEEPNPALALDTSPFYVPQQAQPWERLTPQVPLRAGVSSFGVGGTNAHAVLEEAPERAPSGPSRERQLLLLSARSDTALDTLSERLREHLQGLDALDSEDEASRLADIAWTLRQGRTVLRHRRALVCSSRDEAVAMLSGETPGRLDGVDDEDPRERPVVFLFSGQGSQYPGMAADLYEHEPVFRYTVDHCATTLEPALGRDLRQLLFPPEGTDPEQAARELERTRFAQPALFTVEYATAELWRSWGVEPRAMVGHSIGEYAAACIAGVLSLDDALALVAERGRLMDALPAGAMAAVPLSEEELRPWLADHPQLDLAAVNESRRSVVSGPEEAMEAFAQALAKGEGDGGRRIPLRRLHTSHAFHSAMMEPMLEDFTRRVAAVELKTPEVPYLSNVTGQWITNEEATDPAYYARHLRQAVRFADGVAKLLEDEENLFLEVGPGRTLATLTRRHPGHQGQPVLTSLPHPKDAGSATNHILRTYGSLWIAGMELDGAVFFGDENRHRVSLPLYPFEGRRYWIEPGERRTAAGRQRAEIADWFYLPTFRPAPLLGEGSLPAACLLLTGGGEGQALARALREEGCQVVTVEPGKGTQSLGDDHWSVSPADPESWAALFEQLEGWPGEGPAAVVHAWSLAPADAKSLTPKIFDTAQDEGFSALLALARALPQGSASDLGLWVLGRGLRRVVDGEPLAPERAPLAGLCRVLPQEVPGLRCRVVDVGPAATPEASLMRSLMAELAHSDGDEVVALRGRQRFVEGFEPLPLPAEDTSPVKQGGVYLLTGGLSGTGHALARWLVHTAAARLILVETEAVGDSDDPRRALLEALASGGETLVLVAAPGDADALSEAINRGVAHFGALHGVIHAAGSGGTFQPLSEMTSEARDAHFQRRIHSLLALDQALDARQGPAPDFKIVLSSLASVLGGLGQGLPTAADHFLDAFAENNGSDVPWRSLDWDVWQPEGETTDLRADLARLAMTTAQGEEAFRRALSVEVPRLVLSTGSLDERIAERQQQIRRRGESGPQGVRSRHQRPDLSTPFAAPESELEKRIAEVWQDFLGIEGLGIDDNFFDLGGDSFVAVQVATRLKEVLETDLPVARLYQHLTVRSLAESLAQSAAEAVEEKASHLAERRESMDRRKRFQQRRRSRRNTTD